MAISGVDARNQNEQIVVEELVVDSTATVGGNQTIAGTLSVQGAGNSSYAGGLVITGNLAASGVALPASYLITLTASATTNAMNISIKPVTVTGTVLTGISVFDIYMSGVNSGMGITSTSYSGDLTLVTGGGAILGSIVAKKMWRVATNATGEFVGILTDSGKPATEYVCVAHPLSTQPVVSVASGTKWGA